MLKSTAIVGTGFGIGQQAEVELTVTKEDAPDGFAIFYVVGLDEVASTDSTE